jgi:hypothetical protein
MASAFAGLRRPNLPLLLTVAITSLLLFSHSSQGQTAHFDLGDGLELGVVDDGEREGFDATVEAGKEAAPDAVVARWRVPFYQYKTARELPSERGLPDTISSVAFDFDEDAYSGKDMRDDPKPLPMPDRENAESFQWRPAIAQSMLMLGVQHGYAVIFQEKTRDALFDGTFFVDYYRSVKGLRGWDDGNKFFTNYVAHPMQGGLTGFIYVQNHPKLRAQIFENSPEYWKYRFYAFIWSTAWSTQFELGPISQSSIGNVGMYGGMGMVDLVITPTVGTAWLIGEEVMDRYVIRTLEQNSVTMKMISRMLLNPMRTIANLFRFKEPWYRDRPFGRP